MDYSYKKCVFCLIQKSMLFVTAGLSFDIDPYKKILRNCQLY